MRTPRLNMLPALAVALVLPGTTSAAPTNCNTAPGVGAGDQYCEAVPDGTGGRKTPGQNSASGSPGSGEASTPQVSSATASELSKSEDGQAVLGITASGTAEQDKYAKPHDVEAKRDASDSTSAAGATGSGGSGGGSGTTSGESATAPAVPSNSPLRAVSSAVGTGSTVGNGFVWGVVGMVGVGAVFGLRRMRQNVPAADADVSSD